MNKTLPPIYWFWIPIIFMVFQIFIEIFLPADILFAMHNEHGTHEVAQGIVMAVAFFYALYCFMKSNISTHILYRFWFGLAALCCFYVAGEEVSWGQHLWDWATPEFWAQVNDQQETNLHNVSSWFDQKPRLILIFGIVVGTLILAPMQKAGKLKLPELLQPLLPSLKLKIVALLVIIPQIIEKIFESFDIILFARFSEVQELYIFYFVLLYLITLKDKLFIHKSHA